jgi:response regulator RpfG family c-di-GMP phosphodiesterase
MDRDQERTRRLRVLVVDDEPANVRALTRRLRGHEVLQADGFEAAARILQGTPVDVVISDNTMPGPGAGVALLRVARTLQPRAWRFMYSANPPERLGQLKVEGLIHRFFSKPSDAPLVRALERRRLQKAS